MTENLPVKIDRFIDADLKYVRNLTSETRSHNMRLVGLQKFTIFSRFLGSKDPWKAVPEDIAAWCAFRADSGLASRTIDTDLWHLNFVYERLGKGHISGEPGKGVRDPSPCRDLIVRQTMRGIRNLCPRQVDTKRPIDLDCLEALMDAQPDTLLGLRTRALFSIIWAGAMRVTEVVSLDPSPKPGSKGRVEFGNGGMVLVLAQSKTRRFPKVSEMYGIPMRTSAPRYCPVLLLKKWMREANVNDGPVFPCMVSGVVWKKRTAPKRVGLLLQESLRQIGLPAQEYGVRSFRSGCIEWLLNEGVVPNSVKQHSGHTRLSTMYGYLRGSSVIENSPLMRTSWVGSE